MGDSQRIQVPAFITAGTTILMVLRELHLGHEYGWYHILGKGFFFFACLGVGIYARYKVTGSSPRLLWAVVLLVILNCAHSLSYEPAFHSGYNTTLLIALFVYNKSMRGFLGILLFSYVLLVITLFASGVQPGLSYIENWRNNLLGLLTFGNLSMDLTKGTANIGGKLVDLTKKEQIILSALLRAPGGKVNRDHLIQSIWGKISVTSHTLDTHLTNLRKKLSIANFNLYVDRDHCVCISGG